MKRMKWIIAAALLLLSVPAQAAYQFEDITCETTATTGTGTVSLAGAFTNYLPFITTITTGNSVPYSIVSGDGKVETGTGVFTDGTPDTLTRVAEWSTDGVGAELTLSGTSRVCVTMTSDMFTGFVATLGVLQLDVGAADTSVTRSGAGVLAVEGADVAELSTAQTWTATQTMRTINPAADSTYSLGAAATEWLAASVDTVTVGTLELGTAATDTSVVRSGAGEATLEGDAIKHAGKQVMWIPASALKNNATSPASCGDTYDSGSNDLTVTVCAFDTGATEERADFQVAMPKAWNEGTVTAIPLTTSAAGTVGQTVQYEIACVAISSGDTLNATMGSAQTSSATLPASPANLLYAGAETSAITCGGSPAENDYVAFRISRDTSVDNMTGDALLLGIKLFWTDNAATLAE